MARTILSPDLYPERIVRLWRHQDQLQRFFVGFGTVNHMILSTFRLLIDLLMLPDSGRPQAQMTLRMFWYEAGLWVVTNLLFRRRDRFLRFKRPSMAYRYAVQTIVFAAPVPLVVMHIWTVILAAGYDRTHWKVLSFGISLWSAVAALILLLPIHVAYGLMAHRFLLKDHDPQYEPISARGYRDQPVETGSAASTSPSFLRDAWEASLRSNIPTSSATWQTAARQDIALSAVDGTPTNFSSLDSNPQAAQMPNHCPATGYIDAMPQTLRGYAAWLRYPLLYKLLPVYMTFLSWQMISIIVKKKSEPQITYHHPYRPIMICLSGYFLCFHASGNFLRRSLFAVRRPNPPTNLRQVHSRFFVTTFIDPDTNESTRVEPYHVPPGMRIHPAQQDHVTASQPLHSCDSHLGHKGHKFTITRRYLPTFIRYSILFGIIWYYHRAERWLIQDSNYELPDGLPLHEVNRLMDTTLWVRGATTRFLVFNGPARILVLIYGMHAMSEVAHELIQSARLMREKPGGRTDEGPPDAFRPGAVRLT